MIDQLINWTELRESGWFAPLQRVVFWRDQTESRDQEQRLARQLMESIYYFVRDIPLSRVSGADSVWTSVCTILLEP